MNKTFDFSKITGSEELISKMAQALADDNGIQREQTQDADKTAGVSPDKMRAALERLIKSGERSPEAIKKYQYLRDSVRKKDFGRKAGRSIKKKDILGTAANISAGLRFGEHRRTLLKTAEDESYASLFSARLKADLEKDAGGESSEESLRKAQEEMTIAGNAKKRAKDGAKAGAIAALAYGYANAKGTPKKKAIKALWNAGSGLVYGGGAGYAGGAIERAILRPTPERLQKAYLKRRLGYGDLSERTAEEKIAVSGAAYLNGPIDARTMTEPKKSIRKSTGTTFKSSSGRITSVDKATQNMRKTIAKRKANDIWKKQFIEGGNSMLKPLRILAAGLGPKHFLTKRVF